MVAVNFMHLPRGRVQMTKEEGVLSFAQPALQLHNKVGWTTLQLPP